MLQSNQKRKRILFLLLAAVLFLSVLWLVPHTPEPIYGAMQKGTGALVVFFSGLFGLSAHYNPVSQLFNVAGFDMLLLEECVALHYHTILIVAILLTPGQSWKRKSVALICCNAALVFFNVLRLIFLGAIGSAYPDSFSFVHDFIWQIAFAILTVALCLAWIKSPRKSSRPRSSVLLYSLVFSGIFALIFNVMKISYLGGMVWLADKVIILSNFSQAWSSRWWLLTEKSFVMVRMRGEKVLYALPNKEYTVNLWQDMLGLVLFLGFSAGTLCWLWRKDRVSSLAKFGWHVGAGALFLMSIQLGTVVVLGWMLQADPKMELGANFLWLVRGVSVLLPVACCWLIWKSQRNLRPNQAVDECVAGCRFV